MKRVQQSTQGAGRLATLPNNKYVPNCFFVGDRHHDNVRDFQVRSETRTQRNCTFVGNAAHAGSGGVGGRNGIGFSGSAGGGGLCWQSGRGAIVCVTMASNSATLGSGPPPLVFSGGGGGLFNRGGYAGETSTLSVVDTLLARNAGPTGLVDCVGAFTSRGFNLVGDALREILGAGE